MSAASRPPRAPCAAAKFKTSLIILSTKNPSNHFLKKGGFVETAMVFGNRYGTQKKDLETMLKAGKNVLLILDLAGIKSVLELYPEALLIMLTAKRETIKNRLLKRGTDPKEIRERLAHLKEEKELLEMADLVIATDKTTPRQVAGQVDAFIHHIVA
ncbi:MAG: hypothetical protein U0487_01595 [Patescibacteria group bacterium]